VTDTAPEPAFRLGPQEFDPAIDIEAISEHPVPTVTHATFGQGEREVTEIGNEDWR